MIKLEDLYTFIEGNFDFLLVADSNEKILHASRLLCRGCGPQELALAGETLTTVLAQSSLQTFRAGMIQAREDIRGTVIFTPKDAKSCSIPLRIGYTDTSKGEVFLFFGTQVDGLSRFAATDKDERVKELACLYSVAEWIAISRSVREFFTQLPGFLRRGMQYPEQVVVYSVYQGQEYGQELTGENYLSTKLVENQEISGEIRVGYIDSDVQLLPEEQKMLSEIGRMLSLAIERKELSQHLALKEEEEADYRRRFADLEKEIETRTREMEEQRQKLDTANLYLDRLNRGWQESKTRLETIFTAFPGDVALIDRDRRLVMTNRAEMLAGAKCYESFFHRDKPCKDCRLSRIVHDKAPITLTVKDGDRYLDVHALPIFDPNHEVEGIIEFYRDVTLERTYEQQLQQADQLASLGQLVSGIGHEINNPNQFIRGNVKIIKQALEDMLPLVDAEFERNPNLKIARLPYKFFREHVMVLVNDMAHGSERIKGIVEGLKRFARRDEGLLIDKVDVNTAIEACTRLVHNEVHKHAEIKLELHPDVLTFTGNSHKIEQVLVNLTVNASQAMPDDRKGLITVRTRMEEDTIVIEVEDNGKGMNEKTQKQIFDPFFTTKRASGGTGLGLPIAYRIIEEHGGSISVKSELGVGTTFVIRIPVKSTSETAVAPGNDKQ
ncbi:MAG: PAS domain-containing protein [Candidatus Eisenbacteria sp.]|nr:PAS domain-containing protein [Candidatus Eisenbacteria bacterium]